MASDGKLTFDTKIDDSGFKQGIGKLKSFGMGAGKLAAGAIAAVTTATIALGTAAAKVGSEFEASMSQVAATMGMTQKEIQSGSKEYKMLEAAARQMGATTQYSASEASEALNYIALAGYDANDAVKLLPSTLNLAAAGGMELGRATDIVTDAVSALGLNMGTTEETIGNTNKLIDEMAKTSQKSNTNVAQLGEAILTVGGTAKDLAGGTVELNTALGILANNGYKGAEGGTKLRNVIQAMYTPTDKAAKAMTELGIQAYDAEGNMRPMNEVLRNMSLELSTMTTEDRKNWLNTVFNGRDLAAVSALLASNAVNIDDISMALEAAGGPGAEFKENIAALAKEFDQFSDKTDFVNHAMNAFGLTTEQASILYDGLKSSLQGSEWDNLANQIKNSKGAAEEMSKVMIDNLQGDIKILKSALEELAISFYQTFDKDLRAGVQNATKVLENLSLAFRGIDSEGLKNSLDEAGISIDELGISLVDASFAIEQYTEKADFVNYAMEKWGISSQQAGELFDQLSNSMENTSNKIELVGQVIGSTISDALTNLAEQLPDFIDLGVQIIDYLLQGLRQNLPQISEAGVEIVNSLITGIGNVLNEFLALGLDIIQNLVDGITQNAEQITTSISEVIGNILDTISSRLPEYMESGGKMILELAKGISDNLPEITSKAVDVVVTFVEGLIKAIPNITKAALEIILGLVKSITENAPKIVDATPPIIEKFVETVISNIPSIIELGGKILLALIEGVLKLIPKLIELGPKLIWAIIKGLAQGSWDLISKGGELISNFFSGMKEKSGEGESTGQEISDSVGRGLETGIGSAGDFGTQTITAYQEGLKSGENSATSTAEEISNSAINNLDKKSEANQKGVELGNEYTKGISSAKSTTESGAKSLSDAATKGLNTGKLDFSKIGTESGKSYADKTKEKKTESEAAGKELGTSSVKGAKESSKEMKTAGEEAGKNYVEGVKSKISDVSSIGKEVSSNLAKGISGAQEQISSAIKKIIEKIISDIKAKNNEFNNRGKELIKNLSQGMETNKNQVNSALRNILQQAVNSAKSFNNQFISVGANISKGIASGIRNNSGVIQQAARNVVQQAVAAAKKAGQIHSPSRLMANQVGKPLTQGIAVGITEAEQTLLDALGQISNVMVKKMKESQQNLTVEEQNQIKERLQKAKDLNISEIGAAYEVYKQLYVQKTKDVENEIKAVEDEIRKTKRSKKSEERRLELEKDKELLETKKKNLKEYEKHFTEVYEKIVQDYEKALQKIESDTESLKNKLISYGDVVETVRDAEGNVIKDQYGNDMLKLSDLNKQIAQVATYGGLLNELEKRGADAEVMSRMLTMSVDDAVKYGELLMQQSDSDWNNYMKSMETKRTLAEQISKKYYKNQIDNLNKEYKDKLIKNLEGIPEKSAEIGKKSAQKIADGFKKNTSPFLQAIDNLLRQMESKLQTGMSNAVAKAQSAFNSQMQSMQNQTMNITVNGANYNNRQQAVDYGKTLYKQVQRERRRYGG